MHKQSTNHNSLENRPSCYAMSSTVYDTFWPIPDLISCAGLTSHVFSAMICRRCSLTQCFTFLGYNEIALGQRKIWISNVHIHKPILKIKVLFTNMCRKVVLDPKKLVYFCLLYHILKEARWQATGVSKTMSQDHRPVMVLVVGFGANCLCLGLLFTFINVLMTNLA